MAALATLAVATAGTGVQQMATQPTVGGALQTEVRRGYDWGCDIHPSAGLQEPGLKKILNNQAQLSFEIRQIDAAGVMARANDAESAAASSAAQAAESATLAGGAAEVATAAQPLLEALQRMEGRLSAIELKQDVAASGCCVLR